MDTNAENRVDTLRIVLASTLDEVTTARSLFKEYAAWLAVDLSFQNFKAELANLPGDYSEMRLDTLSSMVPWWCRVS